MVPNDNSSNKFRCEICDYITCRKSQYQRHLSTAKHLFLQNPTLSNINSQKKYACVCGKAYKHSTTLYAHKKTCDYTDIPNKLALTELYKDELIITLLKQNAELMKGHQDMVIKLTENGINNATHCNNNTNSNNKAFNLNFFLNETCKNAMNITDFIDSVKLQLTDLMDVGEMGYIEGISKIIVKNLNNLHENERPVHCTDKKRETMYVKDSDKWEKDDDNKSKLRNAVKKIADKNIRLLPQFREKFPDYKDSSSKTSDKYDKMVIEVMTSDTTKDEQIIKKISKATIIH